MTPILIDSPADARLDPFRNVKGQSIRVDGTFVAESEIVLERLFASSIAVRSILITPARAERLGDTLHAYVQGQANSSVNLYIAGQSVIDAVVGYPLHRGVIAVAERPAPRDVMETLANARTLVVLEDVMDPENVGTVFRHAAGFGVDAVLLHGHTGDPLYRKTIRTSMGWTLGIPYARTSSASHSTADSTNGSNSEANLLRPETSYARLTSNIHGESPAKTIDIAALLSDAGFVTLALTPSRTAELLSDVLATYSESTRIAFLLGAEGPGLQADTLSSVDRRVRIALSDGVDSLNVATSAAIALYALAVAHPGRLGTPR
jgi:tRNA G18 (ribose-2'-O)-methylase SpoU